MSSASPSLDPGALLAHAEWVRALARRLVRDADLADDVAQSAWVAAIETPPAADRSPRRWLAAVLRSRAIDVRRAAARALRRERAIARPEAMPSTVEIVDRLSTHRAVVEAVLSLDEPYRGVILLRFFENLSARAIAARSGVPIATVRTRIARALAKLRVRLDRTHGGDRSAWMAALAPLGAREGIFWAAIGGGVVKAKGIVVAAAAALLLAVGWLLTSSTGSEPGATPALGKSQAPAAPSAVAALATKEGESARGVAASPSPRPHEGPSDPVASREGSAGSRVLRGRVVDLDSRALAGVALRFRGRTSKGGAAEPEETVAVSDAAGRFEMARPALAGELEVASPRYTTVFACFVDPNVSTEALIVAGARITVAGSVVDAAGAPVPDAKVSIQLPPSFRAAFREVLDLSPDRVWWSTTDGAGRFEIADTAYVPGARLAASAGSFESTSVDAPQTSTWSVVLRLAKPDARKGWIRGRVVDLAGRPVASAWVGPNVGAPAQTDVDGRFDLQLGVGTSATISAAKEGHLPAMRELRTDAEGRLDPPEDLVLRLGDKPLEIAGTVVDATGAPVANAPVWIVGGAERNWYGANYPVLESLLAGATGARMVDTDALGKFRIEGLLPREYRIDAMDPRTLAVGRVESAPAGLGDVRVEIPAGATHARVAGRVVDREGAPLAGIRVRAARTTFRTTSVAYTSDLPTVTTDDEGRFEIRNVARDEVSVEADGDAVIPASVQAPFDAPADLRIVVLRRCHLQVELASSDEADSFAVLDGAGARLTIRSFRGSTTHFHPIATLTGGRSLVVGVEETATTLVLLSQGKETRRVPLALKPGELAVVRP